nr:alpha carbonic anhydrase 8-like [Aegilops tauschii subsp. strangulata]
MAPSLALLRRTTGLAPTNARAPAAAALSAALPRPRPAPLLTADRSAGAPALTAPRPRGPASPCRPLPLLPPACAAPPHRVPLRPATPMPWPIPHSLLLPRLRLRRPGAPTTASASSVRRSRSPSTAAPVPALASLHLAGPHPLWSPRAASPGAAAGPGRCQSGWRPAPSTHSPLRPFGLRMRP